MSKIDKRVADIRVRVTQSEKAAIEQMAASLGESVSTFMRNRALTETDTANNVELEKARQRLAAYQRRMETLTIPPELHRHLLRIGNNINQIAKKAHWAVASDALDGAIGQSIALELKAIRAQLAEIRMANHGDGFGDS